MSQQITESNVREYKLDVEHLLQHKGSQLRGFLTEGTYTGEGGRPVNQIGAVTAQKRTTRHGDTPLIETPHDSRWVEPTDYEWADLIDEQDLLRILIQPRGPYAMNGAFALGRAIDAEIVAAFFAASKTGPQGNRNEAFDDANFSISVGGTGMTVDKLRTAKRMLMAAKVDVRNDPLYIAVTARQHEDLLAETQAISLDFTTRPVLMEGLITRFMGFDFIHLEDLDVDGSNDRLCPCWAKSGVHIGIWNDITTKMSERPDKSYSMQVYLSGTFGATRIEQGKVIKIICDEP